LHSRYAKKYLLFAAVQHISSFNGYKPPCIVAEPGHLSQTIALK